MPFRYVFMKEALTVTKHSETTSRQQITRDIRLYYYFNKTLLRD